MVQARWNSSIAQKTNKHDNNLTKWCNLNWTDDPHINQIKILFQVYEELGQMLSPALGELARGCYFEFSPSSYSNFVNVHLCTYQSFYLHFHHCFKGRKMREQKFYSQPHFFSSSFLLSSGEWLSFWYSLNLWSVLPAFFISSLFISICQVLFVFVIFHGIFDFMILLPPFDFSAFKEEVSFGKLCWKLRWRLRQPLMISQFPENTKRTEIYQFVTISSINFTSWTRHFSSN